MKHCFTALWYMKQNLRLPVSIKKIIPTCYYRNKIEVENKNYVSGKWSFYREQLHVGYKSITVATGNATSH